MQQGGKLTRRKVHKFRERERERCSEREKFREIERRSERDRSSERERQRESHKHYYNCLNPPCDLASLAGKPSEWQSIPPVVTRQTEFGSNRFCG